MTVITSTQFRANQGRYVDMAHKGERVIVTSRKGDVELTPVNEEEEFNKYVKSSSFLAFANKVRQEVKEGKCTVCHNEEELIRHLESL